MEEQIEMLGWALLINLAVACLAVVAILIYLCWLWTQIHRDVKRLLRRPEVERDGEGRPLRERL
jgi:hypothetical protein